MIVLPSTTYILQLVLSAGTADATVSYVDRTATAYALGVTQETAATAATQTICAAPAASTERAIDFASVYYKTTGGVVTLQTLNSSGSVTTILFKATLLVGETLNYTHATGFVVLDANGNRKEATSSSFVNITASGTLAVTSATTLSGALTYGGVTLTNAVTGTGKMVLDTNATLGAHTLAGTVSGGGNQINNVIIGTSTPLAGSFTTVSASGIISTTGTTISVADNYDGQTLFKASNTNGGLNALAGFYASLTSDFSSKVLSNDVLGAGTGINGLLVADAGDIHTFGLTAGLRIFTYDAYSLILGTNNVARITVNSSGAIQFNAYTGTTWAIGDKYLVVDASGNVHVSAVGPAS